MVVDVSAYMGCGVCVDKCDRGALSLVREASKGEPLEIEALMARAAGVGAEAKSQKGRRYVSCQMRSV